QKLAADGARQRAAADRQPALVVHQRALATHQREEQLAGAVGALDDLVARERFQAGGQMLVQLDVGHGPKLARISWRSAYLAARVLPAGSRATDGQGGN